MQSDEFAGKVLVITGAGGQFGRQGALYFGRRGCKCALLDVSEKALAETRAAWVEAGFKEADALTVACDVRSSDKVKAAVDSVVAAWGRIDLCWNNAGYQGKMAPVLEYDPEDFKNVMDINVCGVFNVLHHVGRAMAQQAPGWVGPSLRPAPPRTAC